MEFRDILKNLPEVASPTEKKLSFNVKLKWTLIILVSFFCYVKCFSLWIS